MGIASNYWGLPLFLFASFNLPTPLNSLKRAAAAVLLVAAATMLMGAPQAQARYASIVMDFETGQVLQEVNADTRNYPASLVKMMTLYMAFEALNQGNLSLDQELPVSRRAAGMPPSKLGLKAGQTITVREVILALVTKSANDAAVVMAEALGTKETRFAQLMTKKARKLGMRRTSFRNASGLPNRGQLSSARDMAILSRALIRDYPQYYDFFSTDRFTFNGRNHRNHNSLLRSFEGADGLKTGYIRASGFNLAASAQRNGRRLIAVVFGGRSPASRDRHVARLLDEGFDLLAEQSPEPLIADADAVKKVVRAAPALTKPQVKMPEAPAAPETTAAVVAAADTAEGSSDTNGPELTWGVQVGAYYRYQLAETAAVKAAARIPDLLGDTMVHVPSIRGQRGQIYRARLLGLSETDARGACRQLEAMKTDCLVIKDLSALALKKDGAAVATN
jgi:D-alanyl-D-alanine carboxypeptidase